MTPDKNAAAGYQSTAIGPSSDYKERGGVKEDCWGTGSWELQLSHCSGPWASVLQLQPDKGLANLGCTRWHAAKERLWHRVVIGSAVTVSYTDSR